MEGVEVAPGGLVGNRLSKVGVMADAGGGLGGPGDAGEVRQGGQGRGPGARSQSRQAGGKPEEAELALGRQEVLSHPGGGRGQQGEHNRVEDIGTEIGRR